MLPFIAFFVVLRIFLADQFEIEVLNIDTGVLRGIITFYDLFVSYMFGTTNINMQNDTNVCILVFENFGFLICQPHGP